MATEIQFFRFKFKIDSISVKILHTRKNKKNKKTLGDLRFAKTMIWDFIFLNFTTSYDLDFIFLNFTSSYTCVIQ